MSVLIRLCLSASCLSAKCLVAEKSCRRNIQAVGDRPFTDRIFLPKDISPKVCYRHFADTHKKMLNIIKNFFIYRRVNEAIEKVKTISNFQNQ